MILTVFVVVVAVDDEDDTDDDDDYDGKVVLCWGFYAVVSAYWPPIVYDCGKPCLVDVVVINIYVGIYIFFLF